MLPKIRATGVRLFRISSALFPLADQAPHELWDNAEVRRHLKTAGDFILANDMRVTVHPGQFCVLSSDSDAVVENAFRELAIHGWLFDEMGLDHTPKWAINIHGGKRDRSSRLIEQIRSLPDNVRRRLTLENDESAYNVIDLLEVHKETGVPIVFDSHHHTFNDGDLSMDEAFAVTQHTWPDGTRPLQHLSNTEPGMENGSFPDRRKHSNMIHYVPDCQLQALRDDTVDVEIEAKQKNLAVLKMSTDFQIKL
jgi:UV DNA damage endonuclease